MIPELYSIPEKPDDADNPVRLVIASGMPAALWDAYRRRFGIEITEVYGSTEAGGVLINLMGEGPPGSMGKPPPSQVAAVLDEAGEPCPPDVPGELCFRPSKGQAAPVTYFRNEAASVAKVHWGWFRSGDIVHMDKDGWFYFHHRAGGGVRRNGDFVNTALVETTLAKSPLVEDVFVYGIATPANVAGEKALVAAVVLHPGAEVGPLRAWCADKLQKNEIPEIWQVLSAIPKTISEKPVERECIALLADLALAPVTA
jgi:crotonobetaine/carnitine-CoA ligase